MNIRKMKKFYIGFLVLLVFITPCIAQNVAINEDGSLPDPKAILDVKSYNKGLLIPRMSTTDRLAIEAPRGLLVFDTTTNSFWYCDSVVGNHREWSYLAKGDYWGRYGNSINDNNFIGTWNNKPLQIRVNAFSSGEIHPTRFNTFWGFRAGYNNSGPWRDSTGSRNTATGSYSLNSNRAGSFNTASGDHSLYSNTVGDSNTANGSASLYMNTTGSGNTASGTSSLQNNTTGLYNTAVGYNTLRANVSGSNNTAIGANAAISGNFVNATSIGAGAVANASNKVRIGNSAVTAIEGAVPFTVVSDGRFKYSVKEDVKGLEFILRLRPVTYQFDVKRFDTQYSKADDSKEGNAANYVRHAAYYNDAASLRRSGFIAQEVEKAAMASGYNFSGIIQPKTAQEHYSLSYESFVVPMVKAIQELNEKNKKLEQEIVEIKQLLQKLK
jgi:trimeric autotransporter adhesin